MKEKTKKLNLGCGLFPKTGYVNVDISPRSKADVVHDLTVFPYPFEDESFDLIEADHVLEHLPDVFTVMQELHRILKKNGRLVIRVPHFSRGFTHADHKRGFDVTFPYYFDPAFAAGYCGVTYQIGYMRLRWFAQPYLKKEILSPIAYCLARWVGSMIDSLANLSPILCSRVWCFLVGGFEEIEFHFVKE